MNQPFNLIEAAVAFLDDRYRRGFVRVSADNRVSAFARYAAEREHFWPMTVDICLAWARDEAEIADPYTWACRLDSLRPFSRFLANIDPATRFPFGSPFGKAARRRAPHIYSGAEIQRIIEEAAPADRALRPATYTTMFGLSRQRACGYQRPCRYDSRYRPHPLLTIRRANSEAADCSASSNHCTGAGPISGASPPFR